MIAFLPVLFFQEFSKELETFYDDFSDLAHTFSLHRGKGHKSNEDSDTTAVGYFKVQIIQYNIKLYCLFTASIIKLYSTILRMYFTLI